jgi:hypothetical protein
MRTIIAVLVGTIVYLCVGYIVFELLIGNFTKKHTLNLKGFNKSDEEFSLVYLIFSCFAYAVLITYILMHWNTRLTIGRAFIVSGIIGAVFAIMANTYWYATTHLYNNLKPLLLDVLAAFMTVGILGGVTSLLIK